MRNKMIDLHNHLFAELERLGDESLDVEKLQSEIQRAKAITSVSSQIIQNAALALKAEQAKAELLSSKEFSVPKMLEE